MQLPLLAAMLGAGALKDVPPGPVAAIEYWKLSGGREPGATRPALGTQNAPDLQGHLAAAVADLRALIGRYLLGDAPFTAKLHPVHSQAMRDYDRLARLAEWLGR
jgi:ATP-dependent helicase/nuclease subunit B